MAFNFRLHVSFDLAPFNRMQRLLRTRRAQKMMFEEGALRLTKWFRRRFIHLSAQTGGGEWEKLADITKTDKKRLKLRGDIQGNPYWILRRYQLLVNSFAYVISSEGFSAGVITEKSTDRGIPITKIALWHNTGQARGRKQRKIIVKPSDDEIQRITDSIQRGLNRVVREANKR